MKSTQNTKILLAAILVLVTARVVHAAVISVSKPLDSNDGTSRPVSDNVWSIAVPPYPLNTSLGMGFIINPTVQISPNPDVDIPDATLHDHVMTAPYIPDAARSMVTYEFDCPTVVGELEVIQHRNGITRVEGFVGDSLDSLTSIGSVFGPLGDLTGTNIFVEGSSYVFSFTNIQPARFFRFIVRKTSHADGYAAYRAFPRTDSARIAAAVSPEQPITIRVSQIEICWCSRTNKTYQIEYRSLLTTNLWTPLGSTVQGIEGSQCAFDSIGQPQRFYRVVELP